MRLVATIEDPAVIRTILRHLGLSADVPERLPGRLAQLKALLNNRVMHGILGLAVQESPILLCDRSP
jgi:hypothetical protein